MNRSKRDQRWWLLTARWVVMTTLVVGQSATFAERGNAPDRPPPLGAICESGTVAELQAALDKGASANAQPRPEESLKNSRACGPLCNVDGVDREAKFDLLLARGADPNRPSCWGRTALDTAILENDEAVVTKLLSNGLNPNYIDLQDAEPPIIRAIREKNAAIVAALLDAGASVQLSNALNCSTPLHEAAATGDASLVDLLLARGAAREAKDSSGRTAMDLISTGSALIARLRPSPGASFDNDCRGSGDTFEAMSKAAQAGTQSWCKLPKDPKMTLYLEETARAKESIKVLPPALSHLKTRLFGEIAASFMAVREICLPADADLANVDDGHGRYCPEVFGPSGTVTPMIEAELKAHFATILSGQAQIQTLIDRLYTATDIEPAMLGFPKSLKANPYRQIALPKPPSGAHWVVVSDSGHDPIDNARDQVVLTAGRTRLAAIKGNEVVAAIVVEVPYVEGEPQVRSETSTAAAYLPATLSFDVTHVCGTGDQISFDPRSTSAYSGRGKVSPRRPAASFGARVLRIELQDPQSLCTGVCNARVSAAAVRAVASWLPAVRKNSLQGWQLIDVDGHLFLDESVVIRTLNVAAGRPGDEKESFATGVGDRGRPSTYVLMSGDAAARQQICVSAKLSSEVPTRLTTQDGVPLSPSAWHYLCDPTRPPCSATSGCMATKLGFKAVLPEDAIGQGFPDESVQINMGAFRYKDGSFMLGWTNPHSAIDTRPAIPLYPLMIHEVGHWLGVAHMPQLPGDEPGRDNIMYDVMSEDDDTCLTQGNLAAAMTAIHEQTSPKRLIAREALLYRPRKLP